ncbi:acyltransferase family protein [Sphingobacterium deserti]|uniref:Acyltransferase 3 n=1 Tax=Sphingobacterium deserti TaxID=1229276 RepID=A0A0B8T5S7_9SPHI|nr:acyltransferase [Sphingobacterium deserti]KGE12265.1 acyltransferase 3 [Sphingobacterium deserti]
MQKQHFLVLDGLRGVAAILIVVFHFMEWIITDFEKNFIGHGFLAVDFFFCLSGFVLGYAYDQKLKIIGLKKFFVARLIRLQPLVVIGSLLGLIGLLWAPFSSIDIPPTRDIISIFLCSIFLIPYPVLADKAYNLFSLNAPSWSLFWEYVANIFYATMLAKLNKKWLILLLLVAAAALAYTSYSYGNLSGGWSKDNVEVGGIRLAYSFCAGLWVFRNRYIVKNNLGFGSIAILLAAVLLMPFTSLNWLVETLVVLFYFPFIISLGAGTSLKPPLQTTCKFLGDISYPLYMTHYAAIWIFGDYLRSTFFVDKHLPYIVIIGTLVLLLFAWLIMKYIEVPIRKYLTNAYLKI